MILQADAAYQAGDRPAAEATFRRALTEFPRHPQAPLLHLGIVGNLACIALWFVSRTVGLPITGVEPVGAWDLTAVISEAAVAVACLHHLSTGAASTAVAPWARWSWFARAWLVCSAVTLGVLTVTGAGA